MNRLLISALAVSHVLSSPLLAQPADSTSNLSRAGLTWKWPWARQQKAAFTTLILPEAQAVMQRDHLIANRELEAARQRESIAFQRARKANLESYVEMRLALARERARVERARAEQLAASRFSQNSTALGSSGNAAGDTATLAKSVASAWVAPAGRSQQPGATASSGGQKLVDAARYIIRELPARTKDTLNGDDELVTSNMARGLPKGLATFIALFMLHIPSVALASLVTGVFLVREHQPRLGGLFLGVSAILAVIIFAVLPW